MSILFGDSKKLVYQAIRLAHHAFGWDVGDDMLWSPGNSILY